MNEFVIKNGFISQGTSIINGILSATTIQSINPITINSFNSQGNSTINGTLSANTINLTSTPNLNNSNTQILTRNVSTGEIQYRDSSTITSSGNTYGSFGMVIDGSGNVITSGNKGYLVMPYNGVITSWVIMSEQSGSVQIDIWKDTLSNFPPTSADTITSNSKPYLSSQQVNSSSSLSGWTTNFSINDVFLFNVVSAETITRLNLTINVTKQ